MLLCIDLTSHDLIKVNTVCALAACATLSPMHVQLCLHLLLESHDHVEAITIEDLKDKHVRALVSILDCDGAS